MLHQTSFQVDFRSRRIHLGRNQQPEISIPFVPNVPYPVVEASIDGHSEKLLLDTGADSLAVFADRLPNDGHSLRTVGMGRDVSGSVPFTQLTGKQVLLGNSIVSWRTCLLDPSLCPNPGTQPTLPQRIRHRKFTSTSSEGDLDGQQPDMVTPTIVRRLVRALNLSASAVK